MKARLLSTKILSPRQRAIAESQGFSLDMYNAIEISFRKFEIDLGADYFIFTSQNAVRGFLRQYDDLPLPEKRQEAKSKPCFCVGEKTAGLLSENGMKVIEIAKNSFELAQIIAKKHQNSSFLFICGNRRRQELPDILTKNTVQYSECIAYTTSGESPNFGIDFDGVLFYSPSGVQSYTGTNSLGGSIAFCIGNATGQEAGKYTEQVVISAEQRIEKVLETAVAYFK